MLSKERKQTVTGLFCSRATSEFLIETCKLNGIEFHGCPSHVLTAMCEQHIQVDINELLQLS